MDVRPPPLEEWLGALLSRWAEASGRYRAPIGFGAGLILLLSLGWTWTHLGIRSETEALFPEDLPFQVRDAQFMEAFPALHENIVLVVEGPTAESTREATLQLAAALAAQPRLFPRVHLPAAPFFEENGLLYASVEELDELADRLARLQPLLAGLIEDESLRGLMNQTRRALESLRLDPLSEVDLAPVLGRIAEALRSRLARGAGIPGTQRSDAAELQESLDWSALVDWGESSGASGRRVIHVQPALDYGSMAAAAGAILRIRTVGRELGLTPERDYRLRMTGDLVLNFDEMSLLQTQVAWAGVGSFVIVTLLLYLALRSTRLVLATVASLLFGLGVTAGFATLAIGHLNMISVAFAVLFIGLGVDFGLHLCMRFQELRAAGRGAELALLESARGVGSSLMLCAVTTAVGFFAFVPTEFIGVAELGVIAGAGMFIGVASSFTIIPAILIGDGAGERVESRLPTLRLPGWPVRRAGSVVIAATLLTIVAATRLPELRFDQNPLNVRDPAAESVRVYKDLLADSDRSPWTMEYLAASEEDAIAMAARFEVLPEVDKARVFADFVPKNQAAKLAIIQEMAYFTDWSLLDRSAAKPSPAASRRALEQLHEELGRTRSIDLEPDLARAADSLESALDQLLVRLSSASAEQTISLLDGLERQLLGRFQDLLKRLERAMRAAPVSGADLPRGIRETMISSQGLHRVEVVPVEDLTREGMLDRFVASGKRVTPDLAGPAIRIHASARAVVGALEQALSSAVGVILLFLFILWRRSGDVFMVMLPLLFAGVLTGASMVVSGIPFNFADVIVLPLLLGIGVDSGIHMVHRARIRSSPEESLLGTSTARAVVFSAMTTIASFGTLALVPHKGMANLGQLLVIGVGWTVIANLILLPALLELQDRRA